MRRPAAWLLAALALLAACTGTREPIPPTLLIVGYQPAGGDPTLALLRDLGPVAGAGRLEFLGGSERPLLAPAVSVDLEDRDVLRPHAWVLVRDARDVGGQPQVDAYLQRFEVADVDPDDPTAFREDAARRVRLTGPGGALQDPGLPDRTPCPNVVQVSQDGKFAVVLDDPTACGLSGSYPVQWLVDLGAGTARTLGADVAQDVLSASPVIDQAGVGERAYFLVGAVRAAQVYAAPFDGPAAWLDQLTLAAGDDAPLRDLAMSGSVLVGLARGQLSSVDLRDPSEPGRATLKQPSTEHARLVTDPSGVHQEAFVYGGSRVVMHRTPDTDEVGAFALAAAAGVIDPGLHYAYFLGAGAVQVVDLLSGPDLYDQPFSSRAFPLPELALPAGLQGRPLGVITWVRASPLTTP